MTPQQVLALAQEHQEAGRLSEAEMLCRRVLEALPDCHEAYHRLGLLAYQTGKREMAVDLIGKAIGLDGSVVAYHRNIGEMHRQLGQVEEAMAAGRRATALDPTDASAYYNLGVALMSGGLSEEAARCYRRAADLKPDYGLAFNNLGSVLEATGDKAGAEEAYAKAVVLNPRHAEAQNNLGAILSEKGKLEEAKACFNAAIAARPNFVDPHFNLSSLKTYESGDPQVATLEALAHQRHKLPEASRARLCFALGKAREGLGEYERAFNAYAEGNRLKRATFSYDEAQAERILTSLTSLFDHEFINARRDQGNPSTLPIFILGMPRSGTSLIEQILASHPRVYGAGELNDLNEIIVAACGTASGRAFPHALADLQPDRIRALGESYLERVQSIAPEAACVTDKMPANFFHSGMIHLMLPGARIIHSRRDAMDTCLSNFTRLFNRTMEFAYDLEELARYHRRYRRLMEHWHAVLPPGTILDVDYENVVADLEGQARRMIEFVGLEWDDTCLAFHENPRVVKTASIAQVRQPIYTSSVGRWRRFETQLEPLRRALGEDVAP
jgi:tetratricopeptide (TPR) repeat protein